MLQAGRQVGVVDEWFTVPALVAGDTDRREIWPTTDGSMEYVRQGCSASRAGER